MPNACVWLWPQVIFFINFAAKTPRPRQWEREDKVISDGAKKSYGFFIAGIGTGGRCSVPILFLGNWEQMGRRKRRQENPGAEKNSGTEPRAKILQKTKSSQIHSKIIFQNSLLLSFKKEAGSARKFPFAFLKAHRFRA